MSSADLNHYQDFRCYEITDESEAAELEIKMEKIEELFSSEGVYLFVRYDIRRIFIWKGPKSPVRKRFISSRIASKIQEESSKEGMHLKIVSVDAGDEPREFLKAFNVEAYEVSEDERPQDMYYLRNEERRKLEDAKLRGEDDENEEQEKEEYWSPILEEQERLEEMEQAKKKAVETAQEITKNIQNPPKKPKKRTKVSPPVSRRRTFGSYPSKSTSNKIMTKEEEEEMLKMILEQDVPENMKRINIVIGKSLYGPKRMISSLFGKEVEEVNWDKVEQIPDGNINIENHLLKVYCKDNEIQGLEILTYEGESNTGVPADSKPKKQLKEIPKGD